jgi:aryl-alcohol dehydrogenase-like predicted oxidoreductase
MQYIKLGNSTEKLSVIGLGCIGMRYAYGPADKKESITTLHSALDLGINSNVGARYNQWSNEIN